MANVLRIAVVDPNDATRENLKAVLLGLETVWLEAECSRYAFFVDVVEQTQPEIALIAMDSDPQRAVKLIHETLQRAPTCAVLVTSSSTDGRLILESMRAGAKEFLTEPLRPEDLATALQRVRRQVAGGGPSSQKAGCQVFAVAGATGGVGASSIAVNLACALAADSSNSVVLVDLDVALGDADVFLDAIPEYTLADIAQNVERLDLTLLKKSLTVHASGVHLLPRPMHLEDARLITPDKLQRVIGLLKTSFTHLVLDTSKSYSELDMLALRSADEVLMITQLDLPCMRNVVRLLMTFDEDEALRSKVRVVVNRFGQDSGQISMKKARDTIGRDIYWQVPNDYRVMVEVRNNGVPLLQHAPKAAITQSIGQLADQLCGKKADDDGEREGKSRRWLNLWPSR
ncbi:MAG: pilus assembly protein CpaE [Planctomycetota bacterium]|nr:MAG: pilus assembly protein CpaE [Planctomycetota bacterium]